MTTASIQTKPATRRAVTRRPADRRTRAVRTVGILGTGGHVPDPVLTNAGLEQIVDTSDAWIVERTGMRERRIAPREVATSDMAAAAARDALDDARLEAREIDLIIVATATPDHQVSPTTSAQVQHKIGAKRAAGFDVSCACSGFVNALVIGQQFIASGTYRRVLVIGADKISTMTDYEDRESCILFGDGAGAVVLGVAGDGPELIDHVLGVDGSGAEMIQVPAGGSRQPANAETVLARDHYMKLRGREVFKFAVAKMCEVVEQLAERNGIDVSDIDWLVPHQANGRILEAATRKLGLPIERVVSNVERYGNTSSASVPLALDEAAKDSRLQRGDMVCTVAFGGGLSWAGSLIRW